MALLSVENVKKTFGDEVIIIENINFEVQKNDRIGLVGINGSGKTTLFRVLTDEYEPDDGFVHIVRGTQLGYMEQHVVKDLDRTAYEEVLAVFKTLMEMEEELNKLTDMLSVSLPESLQNELIEKQVALNERFVDEGGLTFRNRVRSALMGLGFTSEQTESKVGILSGGQKAKLQLAKMLLSGANLLLLDEPTNHLDITAVEWLEDFLLNYHGAYIVVSHDRYFLDKVTNRTFEIENHHLTAYKGNYSKFLQLKAEHRLALERDYQSKTREIKRIDLEKPERDPEKIKFRFRASRRSGDEVLHAENLSKAFGDTEIFHDVNLDIKRSERVFLIGPNGCGKTTLFRILLNQLPPSSGFFRFGVGVDAGYYEQAQSDLDDYKDVIDEIWDVYPRLSMTEVRSALAVFLFKGEDVFKMIGDLSGGERARILLLKLMLGSTNFLLLDEPTNHLDIDSREALENTLGEYDGTLFVISHDRYLINKLADKIYSLSKNGTKMYEGNYDAYIEEREKERLLASGEATETPQEKENPFKKKKERDAEQRRLRAALGRKEEEISLLEAQIMRLEIELNDPDNASDYSAIISITNELDGLNEKSSSLTEEWTELSAKLDELKMLALESSEGKDEV